jgi:hypothetical protein
MNAKVAVATIIAAISAASLASAETHVVPEQSDVVHNDYRPDRSGFEMGGYAGVGYGVGVGGRLGGTMWSGLYLGGALTYYPRDAVFVGNEIGYKFWPGYHWELRPYLFAGAAFPAGGETGFARSPDQSGILFAFQPGLLTAYHFGAVFISAEGRAHVSPIPGALAFMGGAGVNL